MLAWSLPAWWAWVYGGASLLCFICYGLDKAAARAGRRRTPETTLQLLALACGWPGALLAQLWLRHKSSKPRFRRLCWCCAAANVAGFTWLARQLAP